MDSLLCLLHAFYKISDKSPKQKESLALKNILNSKCKTITYQQKFYTDHSNVSARQVVLIWKLMHSSYQNVFVSLRREILNFLPRLHCSLLLC